MQYDTHDFTYSFQMDKETLIELTELSEEEVINAIEGLKEKKHIDVVGNSFLMGCLKPYCEWIENLKGNCVYDLCF